LSPLFLFTILAFAEGQPLHSEAASSLIFSVSPYKFFLVPTSSLILDQQFCVNNNISRKIYSTKINFNLGFDAKLRRETPFETLLLSAIFSCYFKYMLILFKRVRRRTKKVCWREERV